MKTHGQKRVTKLFVGTISLALSVMAHAGEVTSIEYTSGGSKIVITDLGLLPGGSMSSGLAINNEPRIVGLATDSEFELQRPFWDANTGEIVGMAENFSPSSTAIPEHFADTGEMAGTEMYGDNLYQGIYWNPRGEAFALPQLAGVDPDYGSRHTKAHGINNLGQIVGAGKDAEPTFFTHAVLWPDPNTEGIDLGFLDQGVELNYSEAYGVNDLSHVVGNAITVSSAIRGFLWRDGQMIDLGALSGQVVSEAAAINNIGLIVGKSNFYPVTWEYDVANSNSTPEIDELTMPAGFFSATPTAVNDSGDVAGYAGSPNIDAHAILWRDGAAIDLGVWPGGHYSVAKGINNLGQIIGTGTVAGDNLDHALMWTVQDELDTDGDGVDDGTDNCTLVANADQRDTDDDGIGSLCDPDLNNDCVVNFPDLMRIKSVFFGAAPNADFNGDGVVNFTDLGLVKKMFLLPPGPAAVPNLCAPAR